MKLPKFLRDALGARADERIVREYQKLLSLQEITRGLNSELDPRKLLGLIIDSVVELTGSERGFLILTQPDGEHRVEVARNFDREDLPKAEGKYSSSIVKKVLESREVVLTDSASDDATITPSSSITALKLLSVLCAPLEARDGSMVGVIYIDNRFQRGTFGEEQLELLKLFSAQAAVALENARLHRELVEARDQLAAANEKLEERVKGQALEIRSVRGALAEANLELRTKYDYKGIIGQSTAMRKVFKLLDRVVDTEVPVLVQGESGTGKELVARAIHYNGPRAKRRIASENCAAISEGLLESELFGHVKGAFTGATTDRRGLFEEADGGTMFLDEIGEMSMPMQSKLLRVLQDGEFRPVGGNRSVKVDVRIISATNRDLPTLVREEKFREDLFYRLDVVRIQLPPLRERREDIPLLAQHFLTRIAEEAGDEQPKRLDRAVLRALVEAPWPGNVRQLENEMRRMAALSDDDIGPDLIGDLGSAGDVDGGSEVEGLIGLPLKEIEKRVVLATLERVNGNKKEASRVLGISRRSLYDRLARFAEETD